MPSASHLVLVVEDDLWLRTVTGDALREAGFRVAEASNGYSGLRLARELRPGVVVLDLRLPELPGVDLLRCLSRDAPAPPVVVVSGAPELLTPEVREGVVGVVPKPFDVHGLLAAVRAAVRAGPARPLVRPSGPAADRHPLPAGQAPRRRRRASGRRASARARVG